MLKGKRQNLSKLFLGDGLQPIISMKWFLVSYNFKGNYAKRPQVCHCVVLVTPMDLRGHVNRRAGPCAGEATGPVESPGNTKIACKSSHKGLYLGMIP